MRCDTDLDECAVNNGGCSPHAYCTNTPGNSTCACMPGYTGDGFSCSGDSVSCLSAVVINRICHAYLLHTKITVSIGQRRVTVFLVRCV